MSSEATNNKQQISLTFKWEGPTIKDGGMLKRGGLEVRVVDLLFKDTPLTEVSVHVRENTSSSTSQNFSFTCREYFDHEWEISGQKVRPLHQESQVPSLTLTIAQVKALVLRAGFFEEGPEIEPTIVPAIGISRYKSVRRSDRNIPLQLPKKWEAGKTYNLTVTSNDLSLSATIAQQINLKALELSEIADLAAQEFDNLTQAQMKLLAFLTNMLNPVAAQAAGQFFITLGMLGSHTHSNPKNLNIPLDKLGTILALKLTQALRKEVLKYSNIDALMKQLEPHSDKLLSNIDTLELHEPKGNSQEQVYLLCFKTISDNLKTIYMNVVNDILDSAPTQLTKDGEAFREKFYNMLLQICQSTVQRIEKTQQSNTSQTTTTTTSSTSSQTTVQNSASTTTTQSTSQTRQENKESSSSQSAKESSSQTMVQSSASQSARQSSAPREHKQRDNASDGGSCIVS